MSTTISGGYSNYTLRTTKPKKTFSESGQSFDVTSSFDTSQEQSTQTKKQQSSSAHLNAYIGLVTGAGDVDAAKMRDATGGDIPKARTAIVEGYAGEFYRGFRTNDPAVAQKSVDSLYEDLNSSDTNARDAATFALVASRFKNGGGEYNNQRLAALVKKTNPELMAELEKTPDNGVGTKDVATLGAVARSIKEGKLKLSEVFNDKLGDANKDPNSGIENVAQYQEAIDAVKKGDLGSTMKLDANYRGNDQGPGNAGNSPNMASSASAGGSIPPAWGAESLKSKPGATAKPGTATVSDPNDPYADPGESGGYDIGDETPPVTNKPSIKKSTSTTLNPYQLTTSLKQLLDMLMPKGTSNPFAL